MRPPPAPDRALAVRLLEVLATASAAAPGVLRDAYGPGESRAHAIVAEAATALGLACETDAAGNLYMRLEGAEPGRPGWIVGSHLDSVPHGGNFDGAAGVVAGLACLSGLKAAGLVPPRPVTVMAIRAEESTWFPASYIGSLAAFGRLDPEILELKRSDTGRSLREHMRAEGFQPEAVAGGAAHLRPEALHGFVEIHIEQGPTLEAEGVPVGLVTGIAGSFRYRGAGVHGAYGHSGAVARRHRRDAVFALADLVTAMDLEWGRIEAEGGAATVTFGEVATDATLHAFSKIPGEVAFSLDVRSESEPLLDRLHDRLMAAARRIEAARGVVFELGPRDGSAPARLDEGLRQQLGAIARRRAVPHRLLPSGAGHDAAVFANLGVPTAMIFVRNQNGSHNPHEAMRLDDLMEATALLTELVADA